ncbi:hypothetical protein BuS5_00722 [Desulfosarcina sp. BuS5]|uniref:prepilin-type N-terminal cleavage/methylation domain-containing protein n=1 Tax=Desulfosarcina sp. BuS5 TaxID=933262 RepID=UPI000A02DD5C|nr:prepilin-type N-terminal cleavage/methylation domain-containing protein [Desulfosarcina sp. BuS5]WDN87754.1 hypothetical protein BuS5_00722 [Desulfosarcina sp. BuS5]
MKIFTNKRSCVNNEEGFTLIEIIAVIIILGIMAAVAVPKFFDMQEDAKQAVINGALAEGAARFNHAFGKYILKEKKAPATIADLTDTETEDYLGATPGTGENIGDFDIKWEKSTDDLVITVTNAPTVGDLTDLIVVKTITGIEWGSSGS